MSVALAGEAEWTECRPGKERAYTWVAGQVPSRGLSRGNHTLMFPPFLPPSLPPLKKISKYNL